MYKVCCCCVCSLLRMYSGSCRWEKDEDSGKMRFWEVKTQLQKSETKIKINNRKTQEEKEKKYIISLFLWKMESFSYFTSKKTEESLWKRGIYTRRKTKFSWKNTQEWKQGHKKLLVFLNQFSFRNRQKCGFLIGLLDLLLLRWMGLKGSSATWKKLSLHYLTTWN